MELAHWTFFDFVFALIILVSTGFAVTKGLAREIVSVVALIAGFVLAAYYYHVPGRTLGGIMKNEALADLLGFMAIFAGCLLLGALLAYLINRFVKMASLEWIDRLLGGLFGFLRGWMVCSIIVLALIAFPVGGNSLGRSVLAPYVLAGARAAVLMVPQDLKNKFYEEYKKVMQVLNEERKQP